MLKDLGAKEVHMRIACPPLIYACPFVNFSASKSELELITRRVIKDLETHSRTATMLADAQTAPNVEVPAERIKAYATTDSPEYSPSTQPRQPQVLLVGNHCECDRT